MARVDQLLQEWAKEVATVAVETKEIRGGFAGEKVCPL